MGNNACGCVRTPKEDYYVDPRKAPLSPGEHKEHQGRRYFQRKKRKSDFLLQPGEDAPKPIAGDATGDPKLERAADGCPAEGPSTGADGTLATETVRARLGSVGARRVPFGEPCTEPGPGTTEATPGYGGSSSTNRMELHGTWSSVDELPGGAAHHTSEGRGGTTGGGGEGKGGCLPVHGVRRAVSLGAVGQTFLGSPRGHGGPGSEGEENAPVPSVGRRASCCGHGERAQASGQCMLASHEVTKKCPFLTDVMSGLRECIWVGDWQGDWQRLWRGKTNLSLLSWPWLSFSSIRM